MIMETITVGTNQTTLIATWRTSNDNKIQKWRRKKFDDKRERYIRVTKHLGCEGCIFGSSINACTDIKDRYKCGGPNSRSDNNPVIFKPISSAHAEPKKESSSLTKEVKNISLDENKQTEFPLPPENMRVWIRGNKERGEEVIKALTDLGANNKYNYKGDDCESIYSIISGNNITATEKGYDKASLVANFYTEIKLPWKPKDKELVWTWDNDYEYCRELKFYDVKHDSTFTTIEGKRLGQSFDNYAPYEGEYPDWAEEAQKKLED